MAEATANFQVPERTVRSAVQEAGITLPRDRIKTAKAVSNTRFPYLFWQSLFERLFSQRHQWIFLGMLA
ncbi:hypothetical protein CJ202_08080 [Corynebacterium parakroppenstedtii]|nr:hypothetical protein CJ202_08080 [Corynebacterium kroppenstedtii]